MLDKTLSFTYMVLVICSPLDTILLTSSVEYFNLDWGRFQVIIPNRLYSAFTHAIIDVRYFEKTQHSNSNCFVGPNCVVVCLIVQMVARTSASIFCSVDQRCPLSSWLTLPILCPFWLRKHVRAQGTWTKNLALSNRLTKQTDTVSDIRIRPRCYAEQLSWLFDETQPALLRTQ